MLFLFRMKSLLAGAVNIKSTRQFLFVKHLGNIELVKALLILKSSYRVVVSDKEMIIAAFYGCSGSHELTQLEDMQHWSPNGPSRTNGQNTVLTIKNNQTIRKDCQRHKRQTKTNQGEGASFLTFAFCVSERNVGSHRK